MWNQLKSIVRDDNQSFPFCRGWILTQMTYIEEEHKAKTTRVIANIKSPFEVEIKER